MKPVVITFILILSFCFAVSAQEKKIDNCPKIKVTGPSGAVQPGDTMTFSVNVLSDDIQNLKYNWAINNGTIISGQSTPVINVDTTGIDEGEIKATVEVIGLGDSCSNKGEETGTVNIGCGLPMTIENYGNLNFEEEKLRLQNIAEFIRKSPESGAIFFIYYPESSDVGKLKARLENVSNYLTKDLSISQNKFNFFILVKDNEYGTTVYSISPEDSSLNINWRKDLDELISNSQEKKKSPK